MDAHVKNETPKRPGWLFYIAWILLTILPFPVAFFLDMAILRLVISFVGGVIYVNGVRHITEDYLLIYFLIPTIGLLTGAFQYALLRQYLPRMGWWVFTTLGGWLLGMLLVAILSWLKWTDTVGNNVGLVFIVMGISIGLVQWLLLRRRLHSSELWIAASLVGWGLLSVAMPRSYVDQFWWLVLGFYRLVRRPEYWRCS